MKSSNLTLKTKEFNGLLGCLSKIQDSAILEVKRDEIYSIVSSEDRSLFLWASLSGDFEEEVSLNIPSLAKLSSALDIVGSTEIVFGLTRNHLEYRGKTLKFNYHLYDDGILSKPKVTLAKIKSLTYDFEFEISKVFLKSLLKNSSVFKGTNKLYIYTEDGHLVWSLADKTMTNSDNLTIIGDSVDFEMDEFILNLDNVRLLSFQDGHNEATFKINKNGIGKIELTFGDLSLNYIVTSLTQ